MAAVDVLQKVKEAEREHEERMNQAKEASEKKIAEANRQAKEIIEKAKEEANHKASGMISEAEQRAASEVEENKSDRKKEIEHIKDLASKNMDSAISVIVERIVR